MQNNGLCPLSLFLSSAQGEDGDASLRAFAASPMAPGALGLSLLLRGHDPQENRTEPQSLRQNRLDR